MKKALVFSILSLGVAIQLAGAADNSGLVSYFDSHLFTVNFSAFGGLELTYQGQTYSPRIGLPAPVRNALTSYPDSKELFGSYAKRNRVGNILLWTSLGAVLGASTYTIYYASAHPGISGPDYVSSPSYWIPLGVVTAGLITEIIGAVLVSTAYEKLTQAVNTYNRRKLSAYQ